MRRDCCACSPGLASSWQSHHASLAFSLPTSTLRILVERFSTLSLSCVCFSARSLSLLAASNKGAVEPRRLWLPLTFCEPEQQRKCRTKEQATRAKMDQGRMRRVGRHPAKEKSAGAGGKMLLYSHCAVVGSSMSTHGLRQGNTTEQLTHNSEKHLRPGHRLAFGLANM